MVVKNKSKGYRYETFCRKTTHPFPAYKHTKLRN
jgi:hypothetical protein